MNVWDIPPIDIGELDPATTREELYTDLVKSEARAAHFEVLHAGLSTKYGRLLHACCQLLYAGGTLTELEKMVKGLGK